MDDMNGLNDIGFGYINVPSGPTKIGGGAVGPWE